MVMFTERMIYRGTSINSAGSSVVGDPVSWGPVIQKCLQDETVTNYRDSIRCFILLWMAKFIQLIMSELIFMH